MQIPQQVLGSLTDTDKQEYEIWQELLNSRGYRLLVDFLSEQQASTQSVIDNANTWDAYVYARGQRDGLGNVLNLEAILEAKIEQVAEELEEIAEEESDTVSDDLSVNLNLE
jgi:hypothetical protein